MFRRMNIGRTRHRLPGEDYHLTSWSRSGLSPHMTCNQECWSLQQRIPSAQLPEGPYSEYFWTSRCHVTPHPPDSQLNEIWIMTTKCVCPPTSSPPSSLHSEISTVLIQPLVVGFDVGKWVFFGYALGLKVGFPPSKNESDVGEQAIGEKWIGERVIGERENLGASDWEVIEKKNTVRNEQEYFFFDTPSACHENL